MNIRTQPLTTEKFKLYGQFVQFPKGTKPTIATDDLAYWKQRAIMKIKGDVEVGVLKIKKHKMVFSQMEKHVKTPEMLVGLDADFIVPVAPPSKNVPPAEQIKAFHVKRGQAIIMNTACWHWTPNPAGKDEATILVIFKNNTSKNDLVIKDLSEKCEVV